jgi:hypothetical protein
VDISFHSPPLDIYIYVRTQLKIRRICKLFEKILNLSSNLKVLQINLKHYLVGNLILFTVVYFNFENFEIFIKIFLKNMKNALNLCKMCKFLRFNFKKFATSTDHLVEN